MKFTTILALASLACQTLVFAQNPTPPAQPDTKALEAQMSAMFNRLSAQIREQEQRIRSLEDLPEIRIPTMIRAELRQIEAAVQVFCTENKVMQCSLLDLVGPDKLMRAVPSFDGESYDHLRLALDQSEWKVVTSTGLSIVYKLSVTDQKLTQGFKR
jgi:hypothetical protein